MKHLFKRTYLLTIIILFLFSVQACFSQTYATYNDLAKTAFDNKNYDLCIDYCNKSLNIEANGWAYWERGIAYYDLYKYSDAVNDYLKAVPYYSSDNTSLANLHFNIANAYSADFKYELSIDEFNKAYNYNYKDFGLLYKNRGNAYYFTGKYSEAESDYTNAISYFSSDPKTLSDIYYFRGEAKNYEKNTDDALTDFDKAIDVDPGNSKVYELRAEILKNKSQYAKAIDDLTKAINYGKDQTLSFYFIAEDYKNRADCYYKLHDYELAIKDAEAAYQTDTLVSNWWNLGLYQYAAGLNEDAIKSYKKEMALRKDTLSIVYLDRNIALCYKEMLDYRSAMNEINQALHIKMNYAEAIWTKAVLYNDSKLYQNSIEEYNKAILLFADNKETLSSIYVELGDLYFLKLKDNNKASEYFSLALSANPESENVLYEYGRFMVQSKKNIEDGKSKLQLCADKNLAGDTSSRYSYAKFFMGEKDIAFGNMFRLAEKYQKDTYQYKWQLHVIACLYSLSNNLQKAIEFQEKAFKAGFNDFDHLLNDKDFINIQNTPEYKNLLSRYKMPLPKYCIK